MTVQIVELIRFQVNSERAEEFLARRAEVDDVLKTFPGYLGADLIQVVDEQWLLIVHWQDHDSVIAAQQITKDMPLISAWIGIATQVISFNTSEMRYTRG